MFSHHCLTPLCLLPSPPTPFPYSHHIVVHVHEFSLFFSCSIPPLPPTPPPTTRAACLLSIYKSSQSLFCLVWLTLKLKPAPRYRPACSMKLATKRNPAKPPRSCCLLSLTACPPSPESFQAWNPSLWKKSLFRLDFEMLEDSEVQVFSLLQSSFWIKSLPS